MPCDVGGVFAALRGVGEVVRVLAELCARKEQGVRVG
jgi:hypothetical protein